MPQWKPRPGASWDAVASGPARLVAGRRYWLAVLGRGGALVLRGGRLSPCVVQTASRNGLVSLPVSWRKGRSHVGCPIAVDAVAEVTPNVVSDAFPPALTTPLSSIATGEPPPESLPGPTNTTAPLIGGSTVQGQTLTAGEGSWTGSPTSYAHQWQDCNASGTGCSSVGGATASSYKLGAGDVGHTIRVVVTATNAGGSTPATSEASSIVTGGTGEHSPVCSSVVSSVSAAAALVSAAGSGSVVCLAAGSYGQLELSGAHAGNVTVESVPGSEVVLGGVRIAAGASDLTVHNFVVREFFLDPGASHIVIDHNDISGGGEGVVNSSVNCSSPNAPVYQGCTSTAPDSFITISANKIHGFGEGGSEDAVHLSNWEHVTITANDIYNLEEHGNHTDAFQSVFGGSGMVFDHNYEHDNQAQGFFIKDGDASDVTVSDNLFLRNNNLGEGESNIQVFNTTGFVMTNNTVWDGQGDLIRAEGAAEPLTASVNHNVEQLFSVLHEGGPAYTLSEDYDIFKERPLFAIGPHSTVQGKPVFLDPAADDYRLASNPNRIGVDWAPAEYVYGPTGN